MAVFNFEREQGLKNVQEYAGPVVRGAGGPTPEESIAMKKRKTKAAEKAAEKVSSFSVGSKSSEGCTSKYVNFEVAVYVSSARV